MAQGTRHVQNVEPFVLRCKNACSRLAGHKIIVPEKGDFFVAGTAFRCVSWSWAFFLRAQNARFARLSSFLDPLCRDHFACQARRFSCLGITFFVAGDMNTWYRNTQWYRDIRFLAALCFFWRFASSAKFPFAYTKFSLRTAGRMPLACVGRSFLFLLKRFCQGICQRSWQISCKDLAQRSPTGILKRVLPQWFCRETSYREFPQRCSYFIKISETFLKFSCQEGSLPRDLQ